MIQLRKIVASVSTLAMMIGVVPQVSADGPFSDVPSTNEFATFIQDLKDQGIVSGVGATGMFMPLRNVSRGEMMKMVINALSKSVQGRDSLGVLVNVPMLAGAPHFSDVPAGSSFYSQVEQGYALGMVQGRTAPAAGQMGTFGVDAPVLRQEAMKMIVRGYRIIAGQTYAQDLTGGPSFSDVSTSSEFYDYIQTAYNLGMVNGYGHSMFGPMDPMRRDQMAKVVSNAMKVFVSGKPLSVGVPAQIVLENSDPQIRNDGVSTSSITCTVVDRNGNRIGDWTQPMVFTTDAGTLVVVGTGEAAASSKTVASDKGRGQITLRSATTAGTASVKCKTGSYEGTTRIEFTSAAPGIRNGFGSAHISGVGELNIRITDDAIVANGESRPFGADSDDTAATPTYATSNSTVDPVNGFATVEAFVYDDEGDPRCSDSLIFSIKEGNGHLQLGSAATGTSGVPTTSHTGTAVRSLTVPASACVNGRYVAYLNVLDTQNAGDVTIQVLDRTTTPSLLTTATVNIQLVKLEAKVYDDTILTRNSGQISAGEATSSNVTPVVIKTLDEHNSPFLTADKNASGVDAKNEDDIECRFVGGPVEDAKLEGSNPTTFALGLQSNRAYARYIAGSAGMYVINVIGGTNGGTLEVECRDIDSIGQPSVRVSVTVREPTIEMFVSSDNVGVNGQSAIMARVLDGDKAVFGEELRLTMDGGDGELDEYGNGSYTRADAQDTITMDHICYNNDVTDRTQTESLNLADTVGAAAYATVQIVPFGTACSTNYVDSGWYTARLYGPATVERDQTQSIRATDISRGSQPPEDRISVVSTTDNPSDMSSVTVLPLRQTVAINQDIPTIIFAQEQDGIGLPCVATGATLITNGEAVTETQSGCHVDRNGDAALTPADGITINSHTVDAATLGALAVNADTIENVRLYARGAGTIDTTNNDHWILNNIGAGAYFMVAQAKDREDRGYWKVESYDSDSVAQEYGEVQVDIVANTITSEFNVDATIPDWNNTLLTFVSDENGDPVVGLESCRGGDTVVGSASTFPTNNFSDFVITRGGVDVADLAPVQSLNATASRTSAANIPGAGCLGASPSVDTTDLINTVAGGVVGSGLYAFNLDTNKDVTPGTLTVTTSLNQATNPHDSASYRVQDPTVELTAWPQHVTTSNIVPLTVIVRDENGDPLDIGQNLSGSETMADRLQLELTSGSGNLEQTNATTVNDGLRTFAVESTDGVYPASFKASSVKGSVEIVARVNAISSRVEDSLTLPVD